FKCDRHSAARERQYQETPGLGVFIELCCQELARFSPMLKSGHPRHIPYSRNLVFRAIARPTLVFIRFASAQKLVSQKCPDSVARRVVFQNTNTTYEHSIRLL